MAFRGIRLSSQLKELRLHLCQTSSESAGVREFIQKYYVGIKRQNPDIPILVREYSGIQPRLWARFDGGAESSVALTNLKADDILQQLEKIVKTDQTASPQRKTASAY